MAHKLILNKGYEEQVYEFDAIGKAFDAAMPFIMDGFIARMTDKNGVVKYTQALTDGQIATYSGDATATQAATNETKASDKNRGARKTPWWKFWRLESNRHG
jgi:hypothetical protein